MTDTNDDLERRRVDAERRVEAAVACLRQSAGTEVLARLGEHLEAIAAAVVGSDRRAA